MNWTGSSTPGDPAESESQATSESGEDPRRGLPSTHRLVAAAEEAGLVEWYGRRLVTVHARELLEELRSGAGASVRGASVPGAGADPWMSHLAQRLAHSGGGPVRRVINATGIFLHTNLGRAPLAPAAREALPGLMDAACDLEIDLETGRRDDRNRRAAARLRRLTGAQDAVVVNNNAAALVLALSALAAGREVVVSRGELVEIGGSFRIPDILAASGARLVEVGTTNRTRIGDYESAIGEETALLLKVFPSNYRIEGFTEETSPEELAGLAKRCGIPLLVDEGSGLLRARSEPAFGRHRDIEALLEAGCDLVCGSADKVLGGPQAGLLCGEAELVRGCRRHPLYRALRPGRLILSALIATLDLHLRERPLPLDRLFVDPDAHRERLQTAVERWSREALGAAELRIVPGAAFVGGGSAPGERVEGEVLALEADPDVARRLRTGDRPVVGRMSEGRLLLDLRTVDPDDDESLLRALRSAVDGAA